MEAPPFPAAPTADTITPMAAESADSSPRSRKTNSWDTDPPPTQQLRLMCSYGGHIVPRPHDKTLCYIGGETRIIVIERYVSLSDLRHHLSKTLLHNQPFVLKYQLPNEDLDSLISVATNEDLENMVEEYDRLNHAAPKNGRLRVFLFPKTSSNNIEQLLVQTASTKSEEWFFNALNGKGSTLSAGASDRGFSESSSVNNLLGLDDDLVGKVTVAGKEAEPQIEGSKSGNNNAINTNYDGNFSVPDSPLLETTSSFGSTSSTPSVANLPPLRVHVDENPKVGLGIEDQLQQMNLGVAGNVNLGATQEVAAFVAAADYPNRVFSDDEKSDHGGYRKVPQIQPQIQRQLPVPQFQQKPAVLQFDLATPDSLSSEGSITNPLSRQRQATYQETVFQEQPGNPRVATTSTITADPKTLDQNKPKIQIQESNYVLSGQYKQNHPQLHHPQQFIHGGNQYVPAAAMPVASYYPIYPSQQQNHPHQQYPIYFAPASRPTQGYNIPMQQSNNYNELPNTTSSRPLTPPTGTAPHATYNQSKPEISSGVYRTAAGMGQQLVQGPQYAGFTQMHQPSQSMAPPSGTNSNYTYEFTDPSHTQMYYNPALPPQFSGHYQTLTSGPSVVVSDVSGHVPTESMKQQVRNLQP